MVSYCGAAMVRPARASCRYLTQGLRKGALILLFCASLGSVGVYAQNGTWNGPGNSWNSAANWLPNTAVPTGIATFGAASITAITASAASVNTLQFNSGAPAYSLAINTIVSSGFIITGTGIANSSSNAPTFTVAAGTLLQQHECHELGR